MKHSLRTNIILELLLIIGSVPIFRSLWYALDTVSFFNESIGLIVSFIAGLIVCVLAFYFFQSK
ncbi:MAG TPA: hypothetical protein VI790_00430 [Candidatus Nanoarchaeia archaeon]|nr:hypothetical protein [Candidatus Nanoarchaeia archaeon]